MQVQVGLLRVELMMAACVHCEYASVCARVDNVGLPSLYSTDIVRASAETDRETDRQSDKTEPKGDRPTGAMHASMSVTLLPPRECFSNLVSLESCKERSWNRAEYIS